MKVKFHTKRLESICSWRVRDNLHPDIIRKYQRRIQFFMNAVSLVDISKHPWLYLEKLDGDRKGQYSVCLNDQRRLIFTVNKDGDIQVIEILEISKHYE